MYISFSVGNLSGASIRYLFEPYAEDAYAFLGPLFAPQIKGSIPPPVLICTDAREAEDVRWHISRIGPFTSTGGWDWHGIVVLDLFHVETSIVVTGALSRFVGAHGFLGYPPLHDHHSHLFSGVFDPNDPFGHTFLINHQDSTCDDAHGGYLCNFLRIPSGYGLKVSSSLNFNAITNDVRSAKSPALKFWIEVACHFSPKGGDAFRHRHPQMWRVDVVPWVDGMPPSPNELSGLFAVPMDRPVVVWSFARWPFSGLLLNLWMHTRSLKGIVEMWLVDAPASVFGIEGADDSPLPASYGLAGQLKVEVSMKMTRDRLWHMMESAGYTPRCTLTAPDLLIFSAGDTQLVLKCAANSSLVTEGQSV